MNSSHKKHRKSEMLRIGKTLQNKDLLTFVKSWFRPVTSGKEKSTMGSDSAELEVEKKVIKRFYSGWLYYICCA